MPSLQRRRLLALLSGAGLAGAGLLGLPRPAAAEGGRPLVAAASDLQFVLPELAAAFEAETGAAVELTFGSSGNIARQIRQGAPYQLYLSADEDYVLGLARDGFTRGEGRLYALGRLALLVPAGSPLEADGSLADLAAALRDGRVTRFAIANPEHAPYGRRAEEALRHAGLWQAIRPRLVLGENVAQAAQFAVSGNAQGGLVAHSLALAPRIAARGESALVPAEWHSPLRQRMVLLKEAGAVAGRFHDYLSTPAAQATLGRNGFVLPEGTR
ncbi:MAG: molybdate ABC transporter substrate-binding protein [Tistlia sp.]|uniref:molybdate ABC transporter substrate-binding protein n=1 Tax=Tistlia sp. TaxID=3057121 RepID=UPI0034A496A6